MSDNQDVKVGLISCSGEEISEGTLSRAAVRIVLEQMRPANTVTICLPLFLAGDGGERGFAKRFPTIAVDGCGKLCAKKATEKYSGKVDDVIVIDEILKEMGEKAPASRRDFTEADWDLAHRLADVITQRVDRVLQKAGSRACGQQACDGEAAQAPVCSCMSGGQKPVTISVSGKSIQVSGLVEIVKSIASKKGMNVPEIVNELLEQARIYSGPLDEVPEPELKNALFREYKKICSCLKI
jgi:uncharacterized metal-binding protein